eukprot:scaffold8586_cov108-Isochrysis_galbana.AAC.3
MGHAALARSSQLQGPATEAPSGGEGTVARRGHRAAAIRGSGKEGMHGGLLNWASSDGLAGSASIPPAHDAAVMRRGGRQRHQFITAAFNRDWRRDFYFVWRGGVGDVYV